MTKKRDHFLEKIVGKDKAKQLRASLRGKQSLLDMAGVQRKDLASKEGDVLVVADVVATKILGALEEAGVVQAAVSSDEATEVSELEDVENIVAQAAMDAVDDIDSGEAEEPEAEERAADDDDEADEEEEDEEEVIKGVVKELGGALAQSLEDIGDIAEGQIEIVGAVKAMAGTFDDTNKRLDALEKKVSSRPRQASKDKDTAFDDEEIEAEAKKSLNKTATFLDIPIKK